MMNPILVVDNSKVFATAVSQKIQSELTYKVVSIHSYADAFKVVHSGQINFFAAIVGLYIGDAHEGAVVDLVVSRNIPTIVCTGKFNERVRDSILSKKVIDYVLKENFHSLDTIVSLIKRIQRNISIKIMVVDDSPTVREQISSLLKTHQYSVMTASDGKEAWQILNANTDIKLILTDYQMPNMDGIQLIKNIRSKFSKEELAIIGISGQGHHKLSAQFIKSGANDFMTKPFLAEEFYCRVTQNIEMIEYIRALKDAVNKDYLTGLYNRRYFFEFGKKIFANAKRGKLQLTIALLDIDYFKRINDTYGHNAGDIVLKNLSRLFNQRFRESDIISRFGGEEFCIMATDMDPKNAFPVFDGFRQSIEKCETNADGHLIKFTASIGVCCQVMETLEMMIKAADSKLYEAKQTGRNQVLMFPG